MEVRKTSRNSNKKLLSGDSPANLKVAKQSTHICSTPIDTLPNANLDLISLFLVGTDDFCLKPEDPTQHDFFVVMSLCGRCINIGIFINNESNFRIQDTYLYFDTVKPNSNKFTFTHKGVYSTNDCYNICRDEECFETRGNCEDFEPLIVYVAIAVKIYRHVEDCGKIITHNDEEKKCTDQSVNLFKSICNKELPCSWSTPKIKKETFILWALGSSCCTFKTCEIFDLNDVEKSHTKKSHTKKSAKNEYDNDKNEAIEGFYFPLQLNGLPVLELVKRTFNATAGNSVLISYTVRNIGQGPAFKAAVEDSIPISPGFDWRQITNEPGVIFEPTLFWVIDQLNPGETRTIVISSPTNESMVGSYTSTAIFFILSGGCGCIDCYGTATSTATLIIS